VNFYQVVGNLRFVSAKIFILEGVLGIKGHRYDSEGEKVYSGPMTRTGECDDSKVLGRKRKREKTYELDDLVQGPTKKQKVV